MDEAWKKVTRKFAVHAVQVAAKNKAMGFGSHSFFCVGFQRGLFQCLGGCILGLYFTFSGVNSGFNGVGVTLLGYGLEMGIWAVYCVVLHRILGWLVGWLLLRWMQQGRVSG